MTPVVTVTDELPHRLVTRSHAEGITETAHPLRSARSRFKV